MTDTNRTQITGRVDGSLRDRIAKVIWKVFQNTPPIDATDDEWESWWNDSTQEEKALCYAQADAVIRELNLDGSVEPARLQERLDNIGRWLHPGLWGAMDGRRGILLRILAGEQIEPPASARSTDLHSEHRPVMSDDLRTRIIAALLSEDDVALMADAVIHELGPIPDRRHVDIAGNLWEWCGGQPGTWAWRITRTGPEPLHTMYPRNPDGRDYEPR